MCILFIQHFVLLTDLKVLAENDDPCAGCPAIWYYYCILYYYFIASMIFAQDLQNKMLIDEQKTLKLCELHYAIHAQYLIPKRLSLTKTLCNISLKMEILEKDTFRYFITM